jgi:hypothetical protein
MDGTSRAAPCFALREHKADGLEISGADSASAAVICADMQ